MGTLQAVAPWRGRRSGSGGPPEPGPWGGHGYMVQPWGGGITKNVKIVSPNIPGEKMDHRESIKSIYEVFTVSRRCQRGRLCNSNDHTRIGGRGDRGEREEGPRAESPSASRDGLERVPASGHRWTGGMPMDEGTTKKKRRSVGLGAHIGNGETVTWWTWSLKRPKILNARGTSGGGVGSS